MEYSSGGNEIRQCIEVTSTPCHFGGDRNWFLCPGCNSRCGVLYAVGVGFGCRSCKKVSYQCQSGGPEDRLAYKFNKLESELLQQKVKSTRGFQRWFAKFEPVSENYYDMLDGYSGLL